MECSAIERIPTAPKRVIQAQMGVAAVLSDEVILCELYSGRMMSAEQYSEYAL